MATAPAALIPTAVPLPIAPAPLDDESFSSWMVRISYACNLPLAMVLHQVGVTDSESAAALPLGYGVGLSGERLEMVAAVTGAAREAISKTLLSSYEERLFPPEHLAGVDRGGARAFAKNDWVYASSSHLCPRCLKSRDGAWRLDWRLPWSFACTEHEALLVDTCPGCGGRPAGGRQDRSTGPAFLSRPHTPCRCMNPAPHERATPGPSAPTCGEDLTAVAGVDLDDAQVLRAQRVIAGALSGGIAPAPYGSDVHGFFQDMRALVAMLLVPPSPALVLDLCGTLPTRVLVAVEHHASAQQMNHEARSALVASGKSHKSGPRLRTWSSAPTSAALMAGAATASLAVLERQDLSDLERIRSEDPTLLGSRLHFFHPSPRLAAFADRITGQRLLTTRIGMHASRGRRSNASRIEPHNVPHVVWEPVWEEIFAELFLPGHVMETAGRRFVSLALVKWVTQRGWGAAGALLDIEPRTADALARRCVKALNRAGTAIEFGERVQRLFERIDQSDLVLVDYRERHMWFAEFDATPADLFVGTELGEGLGARRRNASAWLWSVLNGKPVHEAPALARSGVANASEIYRRFRMAKLDRLRAALTDEVQRLVEERGGEMAPYEVGATGWF